LIEDVCVVGGGPAGAIVSRRLAQLGYRVCLIERQDASRPSAGEALPSSIRDPLEQLGLWEGIEHVGYLRCDRVRTRWRDEAASQHGNAAIMVDRALFDRFLVEAATQAGATVLCPAHARRPAFVDERWIIPIDSRDAGSLVVEARFLVDATGRRGGCRPAGAPTIALCGRWQGMVSTSPTEMCIDAGEHAWFWAAPFSHDSATAQVFIDPQSYTRRGATDCATLYRTLLDQSRLLREFLRGLSLAEIRIRDATFRVDNETVTPNSIKVGDRAFAMDPLSSQGVQAAIRSGVQASAVIHTILRGADIEAALEFYRTTLQRAVKAHDRHASEVYASQALYTSAFWQSRSSTRSLEEKRPAPSIRISDNPDLMLSQNARLVALPVIEDDEIRRRTALMHPGLERPVAWLGGVPLGPVLSAIGSKRPAASILAEWSGHATPAQAHALMDWMIEREILN
jgi:2-polyprenyl-6-methoxyphenol hydroxylase-like FAD-dependent oxidoreductase